MKKLTTIWKAANAGADALLEGRKVVETVLETINREQGQIYLKDNPLVSGLSAKVYFIAYPRAISDESIKKKLLKAGVDIDECDVSQAILTLGAGVCMDDGGYLSTPEPLLLIIGRIMKEKNIEVTDQEKKVIFALLDSNTFRNRIGLIKLRGIQKPFNAAWFIIEILGRFGLCGLTTQSIVGCVEVPDDEMLERISKDFGVVFDDRDAAEGQLFLSLDTEFLGKLRELTGLERGGFLNYV